MLHKLTFALLFAVLTYGQIASAQISLEGACPAVENPKDFNWTNFKGYWFENARFYDSFEDRIDCVIQTFNTDNDDIACGLSGVDYLTNKEVSFFACGKILGPGLYNVTFNVNGPTRINKILGTDYKSWAVIFNCKEHHNQHIERAQILTRERYPNAKTVNEAVEVMVKHNISPGFLAETRQKNCTNKIGKGNTKTNLLGSLKNWLIP